MFSILLKYFVINSRNNSLQVHLKHLLFGNSFELWVIFCWKYEKQIIKREGRKSEVDEVLKETETEIQTE